MNIKVLCIILISLSILSSCRNSPCDEAVSSDESIFDSSSEAESFQSEPSSEISAVGSSSSEASPYIPPLTSSTPEIIYSEKAEISSYYGRGSLNSAEQKAYDILSKAVENFEKSAVIGELSLSSESAAKVIQYFISDRPDIVGLSKSYMLKYYNSSVVSVELSYNLTKSEADKKTAAATSVAASVVESLKNKSTYDKIKGAHDWIIENTVYDSAIVNASAEDKLLSDSYNIYGVFVNRKAVCEGYAKAFQYLMYKLGIPCLMVYGETSGGNHVWNCVSVDGQYYYIDLTMDDPVFKNKSDSFISYSYFLITESEISLTHTFQNEYNYPLPQADSKNMNYYIKEGRYLSAYNVDTVCSLIISDVNSGSRYSRMRFFSENDLSSAKAKIQTTSDIRNKVSRSTGKNVTISVVSISSGSSPVYDLILKLNY